MAQLRKIEPPASRCDAHRPHGASTALVLLLACRADDGGADPCTTECATTVADSLETAAGPTAGPADGTSDPTTLGPGPSTGTSRGLDTSTAGDADGSDTSADSTGGVDPPPARHRCGNPRLPATRPSFADPISLESDGGTGGTASGDLDGDGRDEFVARILFRIYDFDGSQWQSYPILDNLDGRGNRFAGDLELADINADGHLDIVVPDSDNAGTTGALSWFENPGGLDGEWVEHPVEVWGGDGFDDTVAHLSELEVGDINDDGWPDIAVRDISHGVWVMIQQTGGGGFHPRVFIETMPREGLALWDPNGDGRLDLLLNGVWIETPADAVTGRYVIHPIGGMEAWYPPDLSTSSIREYACKVLPADFDGDGRQDVVISNAEELSNASEVKPEGISVYLQPDDPLNDDWPEVVLTSEHWSWHTLMVADYNFDGAPDVLAAISAVGTDSAPDEISLFLNDGGGGGFAPQTISTAATVYQGIVGDADNDGDCDLLAPDHFNSGPLRYFENTTVP